MTPPRATPRSCCYALFLCFIDYDYRHVCCYYYYYHCYGYISATTITTTTTTTTTTAITTTVTTIIVIYITPAKPLGLTPPGDAEELFYLL